MAKTVAVPEKLCFVDLHGNGDLGMVSPKKLVNWCKTHQHLTNEAFEKQAWVDCPDIVQRCQRCQPPLSLVAFRDLLDDEIAQVRWLAELVKQFAEETKQSEKQKKQTATFLVLDDAADVRSFPPSLFTTRLRFPHVKWMEPEAQQYMRYSDAMLKRLEHDTSETENKTDTAKQ